MRRLIKHAQAKRIARGLRLDDMPWYMWLLVIFAPGGWLILVYYLTDRRRKR